ncbi:MAG TPA: energy transducer TonB [Terriglobales bacterium]|nr:energy transducer TonB [Terriglobales bacterium]
MMASSHANDQAAFRKTLDSLAIPNQEKWFETHFNPRFLTQLTQDYAKALERYQSHVSWVAVNFAKFDDFSLTVSSSEKPAPLGDSGFESLLPRPTDAVSIENYRLSPGSSDSKHGPPSWVSSFVYIDGQFRYVGGTYPFWAEQLNGVRGPMSIAPAVIHGRTVQAAAFRKDQMGAGIDAIVHLEVDIDPTGRARHIKVLSGDRAFVEDAKEYVQSADFGPLPNIPQFANAKRKWDIEVAFFTPQK